MRPVPGRVVWRRIADHPVPCGVTAGPGEGMANAIRRLRADHDHLDWSLSHRGRVRSLFPRVAKGWRSGRLLVRPKVWREIGARRVARAWPHEVVQDLVHYKHLAPSGGTAPVRTWLTSASLASYAETPDWWALVPGQPSDWTEAGEPDGGTWIAEHVGVPMPELLPGRRLRYWTVYYIHPSIARWAVGQGCRLAVCEAQRRRQAHRPTWEPRMRQIDADGAGHPLRQWPGHAKIAVYDGGATVLSTMNGPRDPTHLDVSILMFGADAVERAAMTLWEEWPPMFERADRARMGAAAARAIRAAGLSSRTLWAGRSAHRS